MKDLGWVLTAGGVWALLLTGRSNMFKTNPEYIQILQAVVDGAAVWEPKAAALWPAQDQPKPVRHRLRRSLLQITLPFLCQRRFL